jgi:hypothetical protein
MFLELTVILTVGFDILTTVVMKVLSSGMKVNLYFRAEDYARQETRRDILNSAWSSQVTCILN